MPDPVSLSTPLAYALAYASAGWYVLPIEPRAKQPLGRLVPRGMLDATTDEAVIRRAVGLGLVVLPGFATASEAFRAIAAGARLLKLFPAATYGPGHLKALGAVIPPEVRMMAVGGVGPADMAVWRAAGAKGFGIGGELYRPGASASDVGRRARDIVAAYRAASA